MWTLESFYHSDEWANFRKIVISERLTEDGYTLDEVTGKPIVKNYDIILHHKEALTEENVNDRNISLNPENIMIVSHKTHNQIHERFSKNFGYQKRQIYLVYGAPLSGKTSYVDSVKLPGDLIVDIDSIWEALSGLARYEKPPRLNQNVFAIRDELMRQVKYRVGKWRNAYIIGGFPLISERERLIREYGAREIFIECSKNKCITRLKMCKDGRDPKAWEKYIDDWFVKNAR